MSTDALVPLASSLHAGPGTFALLIGSGVSRAAGILTGWGITLDLICRLADSSGADVNGDPAGWFRSEFSAEPDYSVILEHLAPSPGQRQTLLARYFEATEEDRDQGLKAPTAAHRGIAQLVSGGYVRVIITTNFDRLLEDSIRDAGVVPRVISSGDHARGAMPLVHSDCTIIKVHGDYLSSDLKNTTAELSRYDTAMRRLLREVFDQYGLVVCGWSAEWDVALRKALLRSANRRFATYWMHRPNLTSAADNLMAHRLAIGISIVDADTAFHQLAQMVTALEAIADRAPQETTLAIARLKRNLLDPLRRIDVHDLLQDETERTISKMSRLTPNASGLDDSFAEHMMAYESASARLTSLLAVGAYFSKEDEHDQNWLKCTDRLATYDPPNPNPHSAALRRLQLYPCLLAVYAIAIGSIAARRLEPLTLVLRSISMTRDGVEESICYFSSQAYVFENADENWIEAPPEPRSARSWSAHIFDFLQPPIAQIIPDRNRYEKVFDEAEYLLGLVFGSQTRLGRGPIGRIVDSDRSQSDLPSGAVEEHAAHLVSSGCFLTSTSIRLGRERYDADIAQLSGGRIRLPQ